MAPRNTTTSRKGSVPIGLSLASATPAKRSSVTDSAVARLRELIMSGPADRFLGSEEDLIQLLDIGRSTLREAVQTLAAEQLLRVKRGVGGGYFSCQPSVDTIVHMASIYLYRKQPTVADMYTTTHALLKSAAVQAANNPDPQERARCKVFFDAWREEPTEHNLGRVNEFFLDLITLIGEIANNSLMTMFLEIIVNIDKARHTESILTVERARTLLELNGDLVHFIQKGDPDIAEVIVKKVNDTTWAWEVQRMQERQDASGATSQK